MYTCFYDLASAFDTVEFSVLLTELFKAGIQGKCWRLIRHQYCNLTSQVKRGKNLSRTFSLKRGIRQGSVLSPSLFNLVFVPLLTSLRQQCLGLSINGLFLGSISHPDDIRTSTTNIQDVSEQAAEVNSFTVCLLLHALLLGYFASRGLPSLCDALLLYVALPASQGHLVCIIMLLLCLWKFVC